MAGTSQITSDDLEPRGQDGVSLCWSLGSVLERHRDRPPEERLVSFNSIVLRTCLLFSFWPTRLLFP